MKTEIEIKKDCLYLYRQDFFWGSSFGCFFMSKGLVKKLCRKNCKYYAKRQSN